MYCEINEFHLWAYLKKKKKQVKLKKIISEEIQCSLMIKVVKIFFHFDSQKPNIDKIKI